jgi:hypothetical protein
MEKIAQLLEEKNHFLEKFHDLNEAELLQFCKGNFDNLEQFYQQRERLLEMIKHVDDKLGEIQSADWTPEEEKACRSRIADSFVIKEDLVAEILSQDLQILSCIDSEKSQIIRDLQKIKKSKSAVGAYRSSQHSKRLDEKY